MVFEAVVVELLNKFLKRYVENLDTSQLKIGIWGGDVVLNDLKIKTTLFDDFNIPLRVKWGKLGKLALKIPWKNLYGSQAIVDIEELLVVLIPHNEFVYDPVKEEKWNNDKKQAKLLAVEEIRKRELEKEGMKQNDGFVEKLLSQIIKNIQIVIRNIHICFEDKTLIPNIPFSVGLTMSNLSAKTCEELITNGEGGTGQSKSNFICKIVNLEGLAIYWNTHSTLISELNESALINSLLNGIPTTFCKPQGYSYVFGPLSASANLNLNPKPEKDGSNFKIPKIMVKVHLQIIDLAMNRGQFYSLMMFAQDYKRLSIATKYRKYRPVGIPVIGHAKEWWKFAYNGVVEDIRRRMSEWSWKNIKEHRRNCRKYSELYEAKLSLKRLSPAMADELINLEKKLNLFNILLLREQAYVQFERSNSVREANKSNSSGWFSNWFGSSSNTTKLSSNENEFVKKIESVMTPKEKEKLYKAIGYNENDPPPNYPPEFVEFQFCFELNEIRATIFENEYASPITIMLVSLKNLQMKFERRPAAFAKKFEINIGKLQVLGIKKEEDEALPELITSNCEEFESLVEILYESKPLNAKCDRRIHAKAFPLKIVYHADTINTLRGVFDTNFEDAPSIVSVSSIPAFQKITAIGLQYAIEKRTILELKINIMPSYLIVPYGGSYDPNKEMLVIMFGKLSLETEENEKNISVKKLNLKGISEQEIFSTILSASYTNFRFALTGVQILLQMEGEDWVQASSIHGKSPLRFLETTDLVFTIKKSLVTDDPRIPKIICEGQLPSLAFNFSEERFIAFAALLCSIPTHNEEPLHLRKMASLSAWSLRSLETQIETSLVSKSIEISSSNPADYVQGINLLLHFEMNELMVSVSKSKDQAQLVQKSYLKSQSTEDKFLTIRLAKLEVKSACKTFEIVNILKLGRVEFHQYDGSNIMPLISAKSSLPEIYLFVAEHIYVNPTAPIYQSKKAIIVNRLTLNVSPLNLFLNKEALLGQIAFYTRITARLDSVKECCVNSRLANANKPKETFTELTVDGFLEKKVITKGKKFRRKLPKKEIIDFFLDAVLEEINLQVEFEDQGLTSFSLKEGSFEISTQKAFTNLNFKLREILLIDLNPETLYKKVVESWEKQTVSARVTLFNNNEYFASTESIDISVEAEIGGLRCTFLNIFFSRLQTFLNDFQDQVKTLKESATFAAQRAKENVLKAYNNSSKILLNIKITAPYIVIPRTCIAPEVLAIDLGVLTIKNKIIELDATERGDTICSPIVDSMRFHLQKLKFSRCILSHNLISVKNETNFVVPISFELSIKRNLSTSWFKKIPEFEILARLGSIHLTLSHTDLCSITGIIKDNMNEGTTKTIKKKVKVPYSTKASSKFSENEQYNDNALQEQNFSNEDGFYTSVKFVFFMDSFVFDALTQSNAKINASTKTPDSGLAKFVIDNVSIKGKKFYNGSVDTSMLLTSCTLTDTRPGKEGRLTTFLERTDFNDSEKNSDLASKSMVEVLYKKNGEDACVDFKVCKYTLILSMDFLHKLREFFTINEDTHEIIEAEMQSTSKSVKHKAKLFIEEGDKRLPTFTINLILEKPDIVIVENMDSIDTDALIFHTEIVMKYRFAGVRQVILGTLNDIELYSCCFNPVKRRNTLSQVIKPFTISVAGSTPPDQGLHIDICLTEVLININPNTVELISKCYETLFSESSLDFDDAREKSHSNLWLSETFNVNDYWFLQTEQGEDALSTISKSSSDLRSKKYVEEICLLAIPSFTILVEELTANQTNPLLLLEMGFQLQCTNWSSKLVINSTLSMQFDYYNKKVTAWEPLIEPLEVLEDKEKNTNHSYIPWELNFSLVSDDEGYLDNLEPPKTSISVSCTDVLPITLTKTGIEVLKNAIDTYTSAVSRQFVNNMIDLPPFIIKNETGLLVELLLDESNLEVCKNADKYAVVKLESNSEVELKRNSKKSGESRKLSSKDERRGLHLRVQFPISASNVFDLPLNLASKRYYPMPLKGFNAGEIWALISDVLIKDSSTIVILRSNVKVFNYFNEPVYIHSLSENDSEAEYVDVVEGNSDFSLPFHVVYKKNKKLFFSVRGYYLSIYPFTWENIKKDSRECVLLQCNSKVPENNDPFFIQAVGELEEIYYTNTKRKLNCSVCFNIHLQPTVKITNSLPVDLVICFQGSAKEQSLLPGNTLQITCAEPGNSSLTLRITNYLEKEWSTKQAIKENPSEFFIWKFISYNGLSPETLNLGVHCTYVRKTAIYTIYCPYFMVNKTDHLLSYRFEGSHTVFHHPSDLKMPVMFSPSYKKFFSKKFAYLQINFSEWSDKFPVDVAGSGGTVKCTEHTSNIVYKISVSIALTFNSLTKVVTFTPFYIFINEINYDIEFLECQNRNHSWFEIPAKSCTPFWPKSHSNVKTIQVKFKNSLSMSPPFDYSDTDACLLRLNDEYGGIFVNIQATQCGTYITFTSYEAGQAPVLILNHSEKSINLFEIGTDYKIVLRPYQKIYHAWISPTGKRKLSVVNPKRQKDEISLDQDSKGQVFTSKGESFRYLTFLDGIQRILLFTDDIGLTSSITNVMSTAHSGLEIICEIHGVGVSLVNNINRTEILYMGLNSSEIIWESKKTNKTRFKRIKRCESEKIEEAYMNFNNEGNSSSDVVPVVNISDKIKVNFQTMTMLEPHVRELRRTFEPGIWIAYRLMDDQAMINIKINRVQIDNQIHDHIFPVILGPVPLPKSVSNYYKETKPFFELSIVKKKADRFKVEQYKYFEILIQEFYVKIDIGFLQQIWLFLSPEKASTEDEKLHFLEDLENIKRPLISYVETAPSNDHKNFYEFLHFSPLKIHFSFSLAGAIDSSSLPPAFSVILQSVGVTLTDMHDVIFRLSYFERRCIVFTNSQLHKEVISHYYGQIIKQAYVLLLGLDVIGNPFGLIVGIREGVEAFFYEPIHGIVHGPSEFATGVAIGCKSLIGRTVGSTAGTLEKLTETLGKGLAVLSLDREYQLQRMTAQNREENIQASMARGGRDLVLGVFEGVTGVVKKPLEGAKEGVGGFFKGMGKGMMGLVTKPVTGVVDFASTSFSAVKRATGINIDNRQMRPSRFFRDDLLVTPYNTYEAVGNAILYSLCDKKFCSNDKYEHHIVLRGKEVAILTNKRMLLAEMNEYFGTWHEHMAMTWKSMPQRPSCHAKGVAITLAPRSGSTKREKLEVKILLIPDEKTKKEVCDKMIELYDLAKEEMGRENKLV